MSEEAGDFAIGDAIDAICDKLVRRHPHVFARDRRRRASDKQPGHRESGRRSRRVSAKPPACLPRSRRRRWAEFRRRCRRCCARTRSAPAPPPSGSIGRKPTMCWTRSTKRSQRFGGRSSPARPASCHAPRKRWVICCLRSPTCRASSASSPRRRSAAPTRSSRRGSTQSRGHFLARGQSLSGATLEEMEAEWQVAKRDSA